MFSTDYYSQLARCQTDDDVHQLVCELAGMDYEQWRNPKRDRGKSLSGRKKKW